MRQGVEKLLADEPDQKGDPRWQATEGTFTHRMKETGISLRRMLRPHRRMMTRLGLLHPRRSAVRAGGPVPQPEGHRRRHHPARLDRADDHRDPRHPRGRGVRGGERRARRHHRTGRVARHVRAARPHVRAPATPLARLLHRREGGRDHDPHDERHRVAPAAAAGRAPAVRAAGAHDGHRHRGAVLLQRRAHAAHAAHDRARSSPGSRCGSGRRPTRGTTASATASPACSATSPRACRACGWSPGSTGPATTCCTTATSPATTATPTTTPRTSPRRTARAPSSSGCSARPRCCSSAATWCATARSPSASSPRSSST